MNSIFTITALTRNNDGWNAPDWRVWGWFPTLQEAIDACVNDKTDMAECLYHFVVIEEIPSGIGRHAEQRWWGEYDPETGAWKQCEMPEEYAGSCNFSMS